MIRIKLHGSLAANSKYYYSHVKVATFMHSANETQPKLSGETIYPQDSYEIITLMNYNLGNSTELLNTEFPATL